MNLISIYNTEKEIALTFKWFEVYPNKKQFVNILTNKSLILIHPIHNFRTTN